MLASKIPEGVRSVMQAEGISLGAVLEMVNKSAITSKDGCNRRFHEWLFFVKDAEILRMKKYDTVLLGTDSGNGVMAEDCQLCDGLGCKGCGWRGEIYRYMKPTPTYKV